MSQTSLVLSCILSLCVGALLATLLYTKKANWSRNQNLFLWFLRTISVSLIAFLILSPLFSHFKRTPQKPILYVLIDHSQSVQKAFDQQKDVLLKNFQPALQSIASNEQWITKFVDLNGKSIKFPFQIDDFKEEKSDLSRGIEEIGYRIDHEQRGGVLLISDGIFNQGKNPASLQTRFPIWTLGVGDTSFQSDIRVSNVFANQYAGKGHLFSIKAEILSQGFKGHQLEVALKKQGKILQKKTVNCNSDLFSNSVDFSLSEEQGGIYRYEIEVLPIQNEVSKQNNRSVAYVEIIEAKKKILLLTEEVHPDVKAMQLALQSVEDLSVELCLFPAKPLLQQYDVLIDFKIPLDILREQSVYKRLLEENSVWLMSGNRKESMNSILSNAQMIQLNQSDRVLPAFQASSNLFQMSASEKKTEVWPPVWVPFGEIKTNQAAQVFANQKLGSVITEKPLMLFGEIQGLSQVVWFGEGFWQWRMHELRAYGSAEYFDELVQKTIQWLSRSKSKKRFRMQTHEKRYLEGDPVLFQTEIFSSVFEPMYGKEVKLNLKHSTGKKYDYAFIYNQNNQKFTVEGLSEGVYQYKAICSEGEVNGTFIVEKLQQELQNLQADFGLLQTIASENQGRFFDLKQIDQIEKTIQAQMPPTIIQTEESFSSVIDFKWIMLVLISIFTIEWFCRKLFGAY